MCFEDRFCASEMGRTGKLSTAVHMVAVIPYFFNQTLRLLFFSLQVLVGLLFEGGYYLRVAFISLASPQTLNDGWLRYVRAIQ